MHNFIRAWDFKVFNKLKDLGSFYKLGPPLNKKKSIVLSVIDTRQEENPPLIIKIIPSTEIRIALNELRFLLKIKHPQIANIYDYGTIRINGNLHIGIVFTRYTESLNTYLFHSLIELIIFYKKLLEGVQYLHENNIVHRDLFPDNILINNKNDLNIEPIIIDFGITKRYLLKKEFQKNSISDLLNLINIFINLLNKINSPQKDSVLKKVIDLKNKYLYRNPELIIPKFLEILDLY